MRDHNPSLYTWECVPRARVDGSYKESPRINHDEMSYSILMEAEVETYAEAGVGVPARH